MIALDTNVLVRFLVQDDPQQGRAAHDLIAGLTEARPGFIPREVLIELVWVLERAYRLPRTRIAEAVIGLLESRELVVEEATRVGAAISGYAKGGAGVSDRMIALAAAEAGCTALMTFDRQAATLPGAALLA